MYTRLSLVLNTVGPMYAGMMTKKQLTTECSIEYSGFNSEIGCCRLA